jgi:hypothetical protein
MGSILEVWLELLHRFGCCRVSAIVESILSRAVTVATEKSHDCAAVVETCLLRGH